MAYNQISVGTSPTLIVAGNNYRRCLILDNLGTASVFIGPDTGITTSNTVSLRAGSTLTLDDRWLRTSIYGVVATGTQTVAFLEVNG